MCHAQARPECPAPTAKRGRVPREGSREDAAGCRRRCETPECVARRIPLARRRRTVDPRRPRGPTLGPFQSGAQVARALSGVAPPSPSTRWSSRGTFLRRPADRYAIDPAARDGRRPPGQRDRSTVFSVLTTRRDEDARGDRPTSAAQGCLGVRATAWVPVPSELVLRGAPRTRLVGRARGLHMRPRGLASAGTWIAGPPPVRRPHTWPSFVRGAPAAR